MDRPQPLPLSWAAVESYAEARAMDAENRAILHQVVRGLDDDWLTAWRQQAAGR